VQRQIVLKEKLRQALSYIKCARKMLVKLTPGRFVLAFSGDDLGSGLSRGLSLGCHGAL